MSWGPGLPVGYTGRLSIPQSQNLSPRAPPVSLQTSLECYINRVLQLQSATSIGCCSSLPQTCAGILSQKEPQCPCPQLCETRMSLGETLTLVWAWHWKYLRLSPENFWLSPLQMSYGRGTVPISLRHLWDFLNESETVPYLVQSQVQSSNELDKAVSEISRSHIISENSHILIFHILTSSFFSPIIFLLTSRVLHLSHINYMTFVTSVIGGGSLHPGDFLKMTFWRPKIWPNTEEVARFWRVVFFFTFLFWVVAKLWAKFGPRIWSELIFGFSESRATRGYMNHPLGPPH